MSKFGGCSLGIEIGPECDNIISKLLVLLLRKYCIHNFITILLFIYTSVKITNRLVNHVYIIFFFYFFIAEFSSCKAARKFLTENPSVGITSSSNDYIETTEVKLNIGTISILKPCPKDIGECKLISITSLSLITQIVENKRDNDIVNINKGFKISFSAEISELGVSLRDHKLVEIWDPNLPIYLQQGYSKIFKEEHFNCF